MQKFVQFLAGAVEKGEAVNIVFEQGYSNLPHVASNQRGAHGSWNSSGKSGIRAKPSDCFYFSITILGNGTGGIGSNSPKLKIAVAEAIARYCLPSIS